MERNIESKLQNKEEVKKKREKLEELFDIDPGFEEYNDVESAERALENLCSASLNPKKVEIFKNILSEAKINLNSLEKVSIPEEEFHGYFKELIGAQKEIYGKYIDSKKGKNYTPEFYPLDIARMKVIKLAEKFKKFSFIATDVVVLLDNNILEKPKDLKEAKEMIESIRGKKIRVVFGIALLFSAKGYDKPIILKTRGEISFKIKDLSDEKIEDYLNKNKENCLKIAGAVDYTSKEAANFIDGNIKIKPLFFSEDASTETDEVEISVDLIPEFSDYFRGVPREQLLNLINRAKART